MMILTLVQNFECALLENYTENLIIPSYEKFNSIALKTNFHE